MGRGVKIQLKLDLRPFGAGLKSALKMGKKFAINFEKVAQGIEIDLDEVDFKNELNSLRKQYDKFEKSVENDSINIQESNRNTLASIRNLAIGTGVIYGLQRAFSSVKNVGMEFTSTMSNLKAISGASAEEMAKMEAKAKELGRTTKFTASQVGQLQVQFSKRGFEPAEINAVTDATLALAAATGEDLASSAEVASGTIRAFSMDVKETSRVTDVMTASFSNSALDLQKYKVAIGQAGKVSSDAGLQIEETTAILGTLADNNIRAERAGTGLRNILLELNEEGSESAEILGGQVNSFDDLINRLRVAKNDQDKFKKAQKLFGKENAVVFATLVDSIEKLHKSSEKYYESAGTAQEKMQTQMDNLTGDTLKLKSALEGLALKTFEDLRKNMRKTTQMMTRWVTSVTESMEQTKKTSTKLKENRSEMNALFDAIQNTNIAQETRNRLIKELNDKYGKYFENQLTEKTNLEDIKKAQEEANQAMMERIANSLAEEEITKVIEKNKDAVSDLNSAQKQQAEGYANLVEAVNRFNEENDKNLTVEQALNDEVSNMANVYDEYAWAVNGAAGRYKILKKETENAKKNLKDTKDEISRIKIKYGELVEVLASKDKKTKEDTKANKDNAKSLIGLSEKAKDLPPVLLENTNKLEMMNDKWEDFEVKLTESQQRMYNVITNVGSQATSTLSSALTEMADQGVLNFKRISDGFKNMLIQMMVELGSKGLIIGFLSLVTGGSYRSIANIMSGGGGLTDAIIGKITENSTGSRTLNNIAANVPSRMPEPEYSFNNTDNITVMGRINDLIRELRNIKQNVTVQIPGDKIPVEVTGKIDGRDLHLLNKKVEEEI
jgi:TP901 family phage tail tape measure protein